MLLGLGPRPDMSHQDIRWRVALQSNAETAPTFYILEGDRAHLLRHPWWTSAVRPDKQRPQVHEWQRTQYI